LLLIVHLTVSKNAYFLEGCITGKRAAVDWVKASKRAFSFYNDLDLPCACRLWGGCFVLGMLLMQSFLFAIDGAPIY
jgi:hypothetical protein